MRFIKQYPKNINMTCSCGCKETIFKFDGSKTRVSLHCKKCGNKLTKGE